MKAPKDVDAKQDQQDKAQGQEVPRKDQAKDQESDPAIPTDRPLSPDDKFTGARQPNETPGV